MSLSTVALFCCSQCFARRLETLKGLTPHELICKIYQNQPQLFKIRNIRDCARRARGNILDESAKCGRGEV